MRHRMSLMMVMMAVILAGAEQHAARADEEVPTKRLSVEPASEPVPALKYRLLPSFLEERPGNAALLYDTVALLISDKERSESFDEVQKLLEQPLDEFSQERAQSVLGKLDNVLRYAERASHRRDCRWELPMEEGPGLLLPQLTRYRQLARAIALKARLHVTRGEYEEATSALQTGFALVRDVSEAPILIHDLVALAIGGLMLDRVDEFCQLPGAPNFYWALSSLPDPVVDIKESLDMEMMGIYLWLPSVGKAASGQEMTQEQWTHLWKQTLAELQGLFLAEKARDVETELQSLGLALVLYPRAKRGLIDRGLSPEEVEAMPVARAMFMYALQGYERMRDQLFKWMYLPYPLARERLEQAESALALDTQDRIVAKYLLWPLLPAVERAYFQEVRFQRRLAALRGVEALRMYAASHDSSLPDSLEAVSVVHVPLDPVTGKPFEYHLEGDTAVLYAPPPDGKPARDGLKYEITIRK